MEKLYSILECSGFYLLLSDKDGYNWVHAFWISAFKFVFPSSYLFFKTIRKHKRKLEFITALEHAYGNINQTSESLGMPKRTLYRKIQKYNIDLSAYRSWWYFTE